MGNVVFRGCLCKENALNDAAPQTSPATDVGDDEFVNDYQIVRDLGAGSYGRVVLAHNSVNNSLAAIKMFSKGYLARQRDIKREGRKMVVHTALQKVRIEIAIMKKLNHPNVVKLIEVIDTEDDPLYLV